MGSFHSTETPEDGSPQNVSMDTVYQNFNGLPVPDGNIS